MSSILDGKGINIAVYRPSINITTPAYDPFASIYRQSLQSVVNGYSHRLGANGGFLSSSMSFVCNQLEAEDWYTNALGFGVKIHGAGLDNVYEGFINRVAVTIGEVPASIGPLMDITNRVSVQYTPILEIPADGPMITGQATTTLISDHDISRGRYGTLETVLSAGTVEQAEAEDYRDNFLSENHLPSTSEKSLSFGGGMIQVDLEIMGFYEYLKRYIYNDDTVGYATITTKIQNVLGADPNGLFSTDYDQMSANGYLTMNYDYDNRTADTVINSLVEVGDAANNRWLFGINQDRRAYYNQQETEIYYSHNIGDNDYRLSRRNAGRVMPWNIQAGKWLQLTNFLSGQKSSSFGDDVRNIYLEEVEYVAPYDYSINGSRVSRLPQLIRKLGLGGIA